MDIEYFKKFSDAEKAVEKMIWQFKYWGGGRVPVYTDESLWFKTKGYRSIKRVEYSEDLYIPYARENGNCMGVMKMLKNLELTYVFKIA